MVGNWPTMVMTIKRCNINFALKYKKSKPKLQRKDITGLKEMNMVRTRWWLVSGLNIVVVGEWFNH